MKKDAQAQKHGGNGRELMVSVKNLCHAYGPCKALEDVSFEVQKGEIFGLLGPNGSGKSTLFRILSTLFPPLAGDVQISGHDLSREYREIRHYMGVVFQSPSLDGKLNVFENLIHHGYIYGFSGKELRERCHEMMEHLGLREYAKQTVGTLSGGLKRRVELAKGLMHGPRVLLLDEPSTGLDPGARIDLWKYLRQIRDRSEATILVTTHLMEEAENCDRLLILDQGRVLRNGPPGRLKEEIGGDVLVIKGRELETLAKDVRKTLNVEGLVTDGVLQIEHEQGARFVRELVEAFPGRIESVTFRKPTLEDVFVHCTGHRFWAQDEDRESV